MLARVPVGKTPAELAQSATAAVRALAAADGRHAARGLDGGGHDWRDRAIIAVAGLLDRADRPRPAGGSGAAERAPQPEQ